MSDAKAPTTKPVVVSWRHEPSTLAYWRSLAYIAEDKLERVRHLLDARPADGVVSVSALRAALEPSDQES